MFQTTFNAIKKALRREVNDEEIIEVNADLYLNKRVLHRNSGFRIYDLNSDSKYELVLHLVNTASNSFSLQRSVNLDQLINKFSILTTALPVLFKLTNEFNSLVGVKKVHDLVLANCTWNIAHVCASLNLLEVLKNEEVAKEIDRKDDLTGKVALHVAIECKHIRIIQHLLAINVRFDLCDRQGNNVYHYAATSTPEIINILLAYSKQFMNDHNYLGYTPLHWACLKDRPECVKALLASGADYSAEVRKEPDPSTSILFADFLKLHGSGLSHEDMKDGGTPLHWSSSRLVVDALVSFKCNINATNFSGKTALHVMAIRNRLDCVISLLTHGAEIDVQDNCGNTALFHAIQLNHLAIVECLLVFDANLNILNLKNESIRHKCNQNFNKRILHYLSLFGAPRCRKFTLNCTDVCSWNGTFNVSGEPKTHQKETDNITQLLINSAVRSMKRADPKKGSKLLCLDGGGIRGLVLCEILFEIEKIVKKPIITCFDWVAGTSTGGILALGLASGKSIRECILMYFRLKETAFVGNRPYSSENLENILKDLFGEIKRMSEIRHPKLMITALLADRRPVELCIFRNYISPNRLLETNQTDLLDDPIIWQVARATGAAPTYFRSFNKKFIDGGLMSNNPTLDALTEIVEYNSVLSIRKREEDIRPLDLVVSIGTGYTETAKCSETVDCEGFDNILRSAIKYQSLISLLKLLIDQSTQTCGRVVDRARAWCHSLDVPYFRLNPLISEEIALNERSDEKLIKILIETKVYVYENIDIIQSISNFFLNPTISL